MSQCCVCHIDFQFSNPQCYFRRVAANLIRVMQHNAPLTVQHPRASRSMSPSSAMAFTSSISSGSLKLQTRCRFATFVASFTHPCSITRWARWVGVEVAGYVAGKSEPMWGGIPNPNFATPGIHIPLHALKLAIRNCAAAGTSLTRDDCEGCMARGRRASRARLLKWSETYRLHHATA
jgi:hypothetical protein